MAVKKAQQSPQGMVDLRKIVDKSRRQNMDRQEAINTANVFFGNFPENIDLQECLNITNRVQEQFLQLPPLVRQRFKNDPGELISFVQDEGNYNEALKMGLISKEAQIARERAIKEAAAAAAAAAGKGTGQT